MSIDRDRGSSGKLVAWAMVRRSRYNCRLRAGGELPLVIPGCDDRVATVGAERAAKRDVILNKRANSNCHLLMCKSLRSALHSFYLIHFLVAVRPDCIFYLLMKQEKREQTKQQVSTIAP